MDRGRSNKLQIAVTIVWLLLASFPIVAASQNSSSPSVARQVTTADQRANEIESLRALLRDKNIREKDPKRLAQAISRVGELRAEAAVNDLVSLLDFRCVSDPHTGGSHEGDGYWAKSALFQIGRPALPALVRVIETEETDSIRSKNARDTIMSIHRENLEEGAKELRRAAKAATTLKGAKRLNAAALYIEEFIAKWVTPYKNKQ